MTRILKLLLVLYIVQVYLTKEQKKNMRSSPGKTPWNKGKTTSLKGKTYEEIHGPEKAAELRLRKRKNKN